MNYEERILNHGRLIPPVLRGRQIAALTNGFGMGFGTKADPAELAQVRQELSTQQQLHAEQIQKMSDFSVEEFEIGHRTGWNRGARMGLDAGFRSALDGDEFG
eukprot:TRINITY_DN4602_c1_g1_i4.p3 TRINITY_DN4602_c1_g1~~TRINITY_DN4602_c1_g1_i4.p3  ORF type:complete len:103 (+),score=16.48 TRINITY_DN4602_c1_g1_i4:511-819(+)